MASIASNSSSNEPGSSLPRSASELDVEHKREMSEAEKLREEVNRTRALRASRQSSRSAQLSISSMPTSPATESTPDSADKITTSASSFPVFAGRLNTGASSGKGGPTSLANFIGGDTKIKGPVLNKVRPDQYAGAGLETDALDRPTATFLSRLNPGKDGPGHFGKNKVAMPGMVRTTSTPAAPTTTAEAATTATAIPKEGVHDKKPKESASLPIPGAINHGEARPRSAQGLVHSTTESENEPGVKPATSPAVAPKPTSGASATSANGSTSTSGSALPSTAKPSSSAYTPSASPKIGKISSPLLGRQEAETSPSTTEKMPTASLTRLQGSNLVKQRLAWGEEKSASSDAAGVGSAKNSPVGSPNVGAGKFSPKIGMSSADAGSSVPSSPALGLSAATSKAAKRGSVLDRWNLRQNTDEETEKNAGSSYKAEYGIGSKTPVGESAAPQRARTASVGAMSEAEGKQEDTAQPDEPASATRIDYKASYRVARSPALAASPQLSSSAQQSRLEPTSASSSSYKTESGVKSPMETPASSTKPSLVIDTEDESPAVPSTSGSTDYKAGYGVRSQSSSSSAYKAEYGVKSPILASNLGVPEPEIAPPAKQAKGDGDGDRNILTPITTAEPGRISPAQKSPAPASAGSAGGSGASFERPSKPPTFSSWPKPQSHSSNFARASPTASPKASPSLPISVSPTPYSPSGKSPSATSPRTGTFQPSATSFPVSLGVAPTHSRPTSLAHFIGADRKVNGPVLNKVRQIDPASEGVDMGDSKGRVGTFLSGLNKDNLLAEAARRKQGVPMPGMVPRSPGPISPKPISPSTASSDLEQPVLPSISGSETPAPRLPLPGMASPTLPLPGEDLGNNKAPQDDESQQSGSAIPSVLPEASSSFFPVHAATITESIADPSSQPTTMTGKPMQTDDPSMSRLLRSGYSTQRSLETIQPSERMLATGKARPTAMEVSTEFVRQGHGTPLVVEPNPWADTPVDTKAKQETVKAPTLTDKAGWQATLKSLGKPARHASRPPTSATLATPAAAIDPPPDVDISAFDALILPTPHIRYVSVDILSIVGASTQTVPLPANGLHPVFYSAELLAIVLRRKEGGLMVTDLYTWQGRDSSIEAAEEAKITELEARYRTTAVDTRQGEEPDELIKALGGGLVTRQGNRETFDVLNTTLYKVQMPTPALTFIDELDLQRSSLASCSSFVASIFQDLFVWHGRGSLDNERAAALAFARSLASGDVENGERSMVELEEGHEDEFWLDVMGDDEYASANHWRFRRTYAASAKDHRPRAFAVQREGTGRYRLALDKSPSIATESSTVLIVEMFFEIYIVVAESSRTDKAAVSAAMHAATMRAKQLDEHKHRPIRPFRLPIHTLLLPSIIPLDLAALFRANVFACDQVLRAPDSIDLLDADETLSQLAGLQSGEPLSMIGLDL